FQASSPYQKADTVQALHPALERLVKLKRSTSRKIGPGRPWSDDEEKDLPLESDDKIDLSACHAQAGVEEIAAMHERTKGAIWALLEKLGRIERKDFPGSTPHPPTADNAKFTPTPRPTSNLPPPDTDGNDVYPF